MATHSRKTGFPEFFADPESAKSARRQFLEAPLEAARQSALGPALELANFLGLLPDAFASSQRRELKRIQESAAKKDPRVDELKASIEQAEALQTMARRGQVRASRSLVALASNHEIFHGFVSDSSLNPLEGLTVRVTRVEAGRAGKLSGTTDDEGYFSISLGSKTYTRGESAGETEELTPERIAEILAREIGGPAVGQPKDDCKEGDRVEILKDKIILLEDPISIRLDGGSVYREYVISGQRSVTESEYRNSRQSEPADSKVSATPAAPKKSKRDDSTAKRGAGRGAKKKPTRTAKSGRRGK